MPKVLRAVTRPEHSGIQEAARQLFTWLLPSGGSWLVPGFQPPRPLYGKIYDLFKKELEAIESANKEVSRKVHTYTQAQEDRIRANEKAEEAWKKQEALVELEANRERAAKGTGDLRAIRRRMGFREEAPALDLSTGYSKVIAVSLSLNWSIKNGVVPSINFEGFAHGGSYGYSCKWWDAKGKQQEKSRGSLNRYRSNVQCLAWKILMKSQEKTIETRRDGQKTVSEQTFTSCTLQLGLDHVMPFN